MRTTTLAALALLAPSALGQGSDPAPGLDPRWMPTKDLDHAITFAAHSNRIVLKVVDDAGARAAGGRLALDAARVDLAPLAAVLEGFPGVRVEALIGQGPDVLAALRANGQQRTGRRLADLSQYFALDVPSGFPARDLIAALHALDVVENAYVEPPMAPEPAAPLVGDIAPTTPDFTALQGYRGPAPIGIDADHALIYTAGTGAGVNMVDVEYQWNFDHEDLTSIDPSDAIGPVLDCLPRHHGTAVLGSIIGDPDGAGVTGLAPGVDMRVVSSLTSCHTANVANAIVAAGAAVGPGDVVLIEQQKSSPNHDAYATSHIDPFGLVPVEYWDAEFNAIQSLTANGIHVVEAAGNGEQDLDSATPPSGHPNYVTRFDLAYRDSGAIVVAAGSSGSTKTRMWFTNHGSRIDAFAWGENVTTTGYGPVEPLFDLFPAAAGDEDQFYTSGFAGTSSASPMVASAVAIVEAVHRSAHGSEYATTAMRGLLRSIGTPSVDSGMSRQPDLAGQLPVVGAGALLNLRYLAPGLHGNLFPLPWYDVDGDGTGDWLIGQFEDPPEGLEPVEPGGAMAMNGLTGEILYQWQGAFVGDDFGAFVGAFGDFNGDGEQDAWVSAPGGLGAVHVYSGADGQLLATFAGDTEDERFGAVLCALPDLDGDGAPDLAVAAPRGSGQTSQTGRVLLLSGATGDTLGVLHGMFPAEQFGAALALVHDVDGLGLPDLAVGAPGDASAAEGSLPGRVVIHSLETFEPLDELQGFSSAMRFGAALAYGDDADGDGQGELAIGAPGAANGRGDVFLIALGSPDGGPSTWLGSAFAEAPGGVGDELGACIALTPDRDGDGLDDLVVGAPGADVTANDGGAAHVVSWKSGALLASYLGAFEGNRFGTVVAGGDLDGDGVGEVFAASDGMEASVETGAAYLYLGGVAAGTSVPQPPNLTDVAPPVVEAVSTDASAPLVLTGTHLETATRVVVDGVDVPTDGWHVNANTIHASMPLATQLGTVDVEVHTLGGVAAAQIAIVGNATPTLALQELGDLSLPLFGDSLPQGAALTTGSAPGDIVLLLVSRTLAPSSIPGLFDADIGGGLSDLYLLATEVVPAKGWTQESYPELPVLGMSYDLYFQALVIDGQTLALPAEASNVQGLTVD